MRKRTRKVFSSGSRWMSLAPSLCIVMPSIGLVDAGRILDALRADLGPNVPILGGGASPQNPVADPAATSGLEFAGLGRR